MSCTPLKGPERGLFFGHFLPSISYENQDRFWFIIYRVKFTFFLFILALPLFAMADDCQELQHVYATIDVTKKSWTTEKEISPISWCIPLVKEDHNLLITLSKKKLSYQVGTFQSLFTFWDEIKNKKFQGGVVKATSFMIQVPLPDWFRGASVTVTEIDTKEIIARGTL